MLSYEKIKLECYDLLDSNKKHIYKIGGLPSKFGKDFNNKFHIFYHEISVINKIKLYLYNNLEKKIFF